MRSIVDRNIVDKMTKTDSNGLHRRGAPNSESSWPSRITVRGDDRAPHRAFLRGLGLSEEDLEKPFIGVASAGAGNTPCNVLLGNAAEQCAVGIRAAGGVPFTFGCASVAVSMSMYLAGLRYWLVSREIVADSVEASAGQNAPWPSAV